MSGRRRRFVSCLGACVLAAALACQSTPALPCDQLSPIAAHPRGIIVPGVRVGPLLVTTGMWLGAGRPELGWARPDDLPKFLVARVERFERPLTLGGRRCADGRQLRFAVGQPWAAGAQLSADEIRELTRPSLELDPQPPSYVQVVGELPIYGGYFIFTAPGRWQLEARDGDRVIGSAVIEVRGPVGGRPTASSPARARRCAAPDTAMTETVSRMFALSATDPSRLPECWTEGKADHQLLSAYAAAGPPVSFTADSEHSTARDGVLFAAVRVKASWAGTPPPGWAGGEQTFVLRQQRDWSWTIDAAQPRTREAQRNPHCAMCHGGASRP